MKSIKTDNSIHRFRGKSLTVHEFAELCDTTSTHIRELIADGMPVYDRGGKGKPHVLSSADCIDYLKERSKKDNRGRPPKEFDENDPKHRINTIKMERAELDLAEKRGDLVHAGDWSPFIDDAMVIMRGEFVEIPDGYREEFPEPPQTNVAVRWLDNRITAILNRLKNGLKAVPAEAAAARQ